MKTRYVRSKSAIIDSYLQSPGGLKAVNSGMAWVIRADKLRFKHGSSFEDLKIPVVIGTDDEQVIIDAILSLAALLCARYEKQGVSDGFVKSSTQTDFNFNLGGVLREKTYKAGVMPPGSLEARVVEEIIRSVPYVDGPMATLWMTKGANGNKFAYWLNDLLLKSLKEGASTRTGEETAHFVLLHVIYLIAKHKDKLKPLSFKGVSYDMMDIVSTFMITVLMGSTVSFLFDNLKNSHSPLYNKNTELVLSSMITHKVFMMIKSNMFREPHNPYGLDNETIKILKSFIENFTDLGEDFTSVEAAAASVCEKILKDKKASLKLDFKQKEMTLRALAIRYLARFDSISESVHIEMAKLVEDDKYSMQLIADKAMFEKFVEDLKGLRSRYDKDKLRVENLDYMINVLDHMRAPKKGFFTSKAKEQESYILHIVESYLVYLFDEHAAAVAEKMGCAVRDRRDEVSMDLVISEYKKGKLYRISVDNQPMIIEKDVQEFEASLFMDLKDFIVDIQNYTGSDMGDFINTNLYKPLENEVDTPENMPHDEDAIDDINLSSFTLGSVVMSGSITSLLNKSWNLRTILDDFTHKMNVKSDKANVSESIKIIHENFLGKKQDFFKQRQALDKLIAQGEANNSHLGSLETHERRVDNQYRNALEETLRDHSGSGMCITFGKSAEVLTMDTAEGQKKFAIGKKVREASLGTLRDPAIRAEMEIHYQIEKIRRQKPELKYPYDIYFGKVYNLRIPQDLYKTTENYIERQVGDVDQARKLGQSVATEFAKDVLMLASGKSHLSCTTVSIATDMYNNGVAVSEDALNEFTKVNDKSIFFFKKHIAVNELSQRIQDSFYFPTTHITMTIGVGLKRGSEDIYIFVRHGVISFKGNGKPMSTVIYEYLNHNLDFYQSVMMDHVQDWYDKEKGGVTSH